MPAPNKFSISILCCKFQGVKTNRATCPFCSVSDISKWLNLFSWNFPQRCSLPWCPMLFIPSQWYLSMLYHYLFSCLIFWPLRPSSVATILIHNKLRRDSPIDTSVWYVVAFVRKQLQKGQKMPKNYAVLLYVLMLGHQLRTAREHSSNEQYQKICFTSVLQ